jgi:hypothetical protein
VRDEELQLILAEGEGNKIEMFNCSTSCCFISCLFKPFIMWSRLFHTRAKNCKERKWGALKFFIPSIRTVHRELWCDDKV